MKMFRGCVEVEAYIDFEDFEAEDDEEAIDLMLHTVDTMRVTEGGNSESKLTDLDVLNFRWGNDSPRIIDIEEQSK